MQNHWTSEKQLNTLIKQLRSKDKQLDLQQKLDSQSHLENFRAFYQQCIQWPVLQHDTTPELYLLDLLYYRDNVCSENCLELTQSRLCKYFQEDGHAISQNLEQLVLLYQNSERNKFIKSNLKDHDPNEISNFIFSPRTPIRAKFMIPNIASLLKKSIFIDNDAEASNVQLIQHLRSLPICQYDFDKKRHVTLDQKYMETPHELLVGLLIYDGFITNEDKIGEDCTIITLIIYNIPEEKRLVPGNFIVLSVIPKANITKSILDSIMLTIAKDLSDMSLNGFDIWDASTCTKEKLRVHLLTIGGDLSSVSSFTQVLPFSPNNKEQLPKIIINTDSESNLSLTSLSINGVPPSHIMDFRHDIIVTGVLQQLLGPDLSSSSNSIFSQTEKNLVLKLIIQINKDNSNKLLGKKFPIKKDKDGNFFLSVEIEHLSSEQKLRLFQLIPFIMNYTGTDSTLKQYLIELSLILSILYDSSGFDWNILCILRGCLLNIVHEFENIFSHSDGSIGLKLLMNVIDDIFLVGPLSQFRNTVPRKIIIDHVQSLARISNSKDLVQSLWENISYNQTTRIIYDSNRPDIANLKLLTDPYQSKVFAKSANVGLSKLGHFIDEHKVDLYRKIIFTTTGSEISISDPKQSICRVKFNDSIEFCKIETFFENNSVDLEEPSITRQYAIVSRIKNVINIESDFQYFKLDSLTFENRNTIIYGHYVENEIQTENESEIVAINDILSPVSVYEVSQSGKKHLLLIDLSAPISFMDSQGKLQFLEKHDTL